MSQIYVLYHKSCTDGTGSKYAAWKKFGDSAEYIAVSYSEPIPKMHPGSEIYILDFSYARDVLESLRSVHKSVVIVDHHKSAEEALRGLEGCHLDMTQSGAVLSWKFFHPDTPVPELLLHVQDWDLWQFKLQGTKEIFKALNLSKGSMIEWDAHIRYWSRDDRDFGRQVLVDQGLAIMEWSNMKVESYVKHKIKVISLFGYDVGITNATEWVSEIGNSTCKDESLKVAFSMSYFINPENKVILSFRSIGVMDVSKIAQRFGGGGHVNASGATTTIDVLKDILEGKMSGV